MTAMTTMCISGTWLLHMSWLLARVGGEAFQHPDTRRDVCF